MRGGRSPWASNIYNLMLTDPKILQFMFWAPHAFMTRRHGSFWSCIKNILGIQKIKASLMKLWIVRTELACVTPGNQMMPVNWERCSILNILINIILMKSNHWRWCISWMLPASAPAINVDPRWYLSKCTFFGKITLFSNSPVSFVMFFYFVLSCLRPLCLRHYILCLSYIVYKMGTIGTYMLISFYWYL